MTAFNSRDGGFFLTTVGRVQTPTLSIVVEREEKIRKHVARDYWEIKAPSPRRRRVRRQVGRPGVQARRRHGSPRRPRVGRAAGEEDRDAVRPAGTVTESPSQHAGEPAAVRPHEPAARGQRRFGFSPRPRCRSRRRYTRSTRCSRTRDGFARAARGLRGRRQGHVPHDRHGGHARAAARVSVHAKKGLDEATSSRRSASSTTQGVGSLRIIPTLQPPRSLTELEASCTTRRQALPGRVLPSASTRSRRASRRSASTASRPTEGAREPGWLAVYGKEVQDEDATLVPVKPGEPCSTRPSTSSP